MGDLMRSGDLPEAGDLEWCDKMATAARVRARERCANYSVDVGWMNKAGLRGLVLVDSLERAGEAVADEGKVLLAQNGGVYLIGILDK